MNNTADLITAEKDVNSQVLIVFIALFISALLHQLSVNNPMIVPYDPLILIMGILWGVGTYYVAFFETYSRISKSTMFIEIYIPAVIFEAGFSMDSRTFLKFFSPIVVIALPVGALTAVIIGFVTSSMIDPTWRISIFFLFGYLLVPIKPTNIVKHLRNIGSNTKYTRILLEGESVLVIQLSLFSVMFTFGGMNPELILRKMFGIPLQILWGYVTGKLGAFLIRYLYNEPIHLSVIIFPMPFMAYLSSNIVLLNGVFTTFVMGVVMGRECSTSLTIETTKFLRNVWKTLVHILNCINYIIAGIRCTRYITNTLHPYSYMYILPSFLIVTSARIFTILVCYPVIRMFRTGITIQHMIICAISNMKHPLPLGLDYESFKEQLKSSETVVGYIALHTVAIFILSYFIYSPILPIILRITGLTMVSFGKQMNMDNCLKFIGERRDRIIAILKLNRFLADVNWSIVAQSTEIRHPFRYQKFTNTDDPEYKEYLKYQTKTLCPECKKELLYVPTTKEFNDMVKDAHLRVLKAEKVSYFRQYENGILSKGGLYYLLHMAEFHTIHAESFTDAEEIAMLFKKEALVNRFCRNRLHQFYISLQDDHPAPRRPYRLLCHKIITHSLFEPTIIIVIILNLVLNICVFKYRSFEDTVVHRTSFMVAHTVAFLVFLIEFVLRILGYAFIYIWKDGFRVYFGSKWHQLDFAMLILILLGWLLSVIDCFVDDANKRYYLDVATCILQVGEILRIARLVKLLQPIYPSLIRYLDWRIDEQMMFAYDVGKASVNAKIEVIELLPYLFEHAEIRNKVRKKLEEEKLEVTKLLAVAQNDRPWIAITVKTKQTILTVLKSMKDSINTLKVSGWVDDFEYGVLMNSVAVKKKFSSGLKNVSPSSADHMLQEVSWIGGDSMSEVYKFLLEHVETKRFKPGEIVWDKGDVPDGIYIVLTGLLNIHFVPEFEISADLLVNGILPTVECVPNVLDFSEEFHEYVVSGQSVGELCFLTGRPLNCVVSSETHSFLNLLKTDVLRKAADMDPDPVKGFCCGMWKAIAIDLSLSILMDALPYRSMSKENIQLILEQSFVPDLNGYTIFVVAHAVEDLVLIQGSITDVSTGEVFTAPCYIPRTVQKFKLPQETEKVVETKILVIPVSDMDPYKVMDEEEKVSDIMYPFDKSTYKKKTSKYGRIARGTFKLGLITASSLRSSSISTHASSTREMYLSSKSHLRTYSYSV